MKLFQLITTLIFLLLIQSCDLSTTTSSRTPSSLQDQVQSYSKDTFESLSEARKSEIATFKNNILKFLLEATEKDEAEKIELFKKAQLYFEINGRKIMSNIRNELAKGSISEYQDIIAPPPWTLKEEVRFLSEKLEGKYSKADSYLQSMLDSSAKKSLRSLLSAIDPTVLQGKSLLNYEIDDEATDFIKAILKADNYSEHALLVVNKFEKKLHTYFDMIKHVGTQLQESGKMSFGNEEKQKFIVKFLDYYYSNVGADTIKNILNDAMMLGHKPSEMEMVGIMFQNSGPGLGKTIQQLGKEPGVGEALSEVMEILEDEGKAVPHHMVQSIVDHDTGGFVVKNISEKPLGTGTMAQVNKATLVTDTKETDVALRYLKPGIKDATDNDIRILNGFITDLSESGDIDPELIPSAKKLIKSIENFLYEELDINDAIKKQKLGSKAYNRTMTVKVGGTPYTIKIKVPGVYAPKNGVKTNLHIQEFIPFGSKFSELKDKNQQKAVAKSLITTWFEEALAKSGFVHSDLHQGNFTVKTSMNSKKIEVVIFDFGLSGTLKKNTRRAFLYIGGGSSFKDPGMIARGLLEMDGKGTRKNINALKQEVAKNIDTIEEPEDWIVWAMKNGHLQSDELGTLARGASLVSQLGTVAGDSEIAIDELKKRLMKTAGREFFSTSNKYPLSRLEMMKFGGAYSKRSCVDLLGKFL